MGDRQITREGIRTENIREATLFIVEVATMKENSYLKVLKMLDIIISVNQLTQAMKKCKIDKGKGKNSLIN